MSNIESTLENESSQVGQTSDDSAAAGADDKPSMFNVWNAMLMISIVCILIACFLLVWELRTFSDFPFSYPWNADAAKVQ